MSNTTARSFSPVDCSDKVDVGGKVGVAGNHIFMDVENLLVDWPTYTIKFTPTHPGPVTLILRLKDASRFKYVEDEDSDMDTSESKACKISSSSMKDDLDATFVSEETTSKTEDNPNLFIATPVRLDAIRKDFSSKKRKLGHGHFFGDADSAWPPRWPRGYRNVSSLPISAFESLKITPADVVAIDKTTYSFPATSSSSYTFSGEGSTPTKPDLKPSVEFREGRRRRRGDGSSVTNHASSDPASNQNVSLEDFHYKAFNSQRRLSAHETLCETHHEFSTQISKSYRRSERNRKIKKRKTNRQESFSGEEDAPQEIGDVHAKNWHNQN
ncbi:uncharacterized protein HD556DRAFT_1312829 [Suillus plorans]|uniref:Uncharacterized protein n=1 Tax=Suillus plorans TaxID=116603 RepID=A0A9P7AET8_9AGAM|nr:uncharacterized protein HD556DRAFT_1312829 [Suillus plorans]KAG1787371.1 hypothetical protein HD556DRAFT_1312829 [Suillus plorans]